MSQHKVFEKTLPAQKDFPNSRQKRLSMSAMHVSVTGAQYCFLMSNKFLHIGIWSRSLHFEESPKSIQDVIGDVYCPDMYSFDREKCDSLDGYVTTPRSIFACGKCGAWLFVHKVLLYVSRARKNDKNRINTLFLLKNDELFTTHICSLMSQFNQPNIERKNCLWSAK